MPWVEALSDPKELRSCIRDLVAISTLPAVWRDYGPPEIVDSVAATLVPMLNADFVYITLSGTREADVIEVTRTRLPISPAAVGSVQAAMRAAWPLVSTEQTATIANPAGNGTIRLAFAPIGFAGEAFVVGGSPRNDFPTDAQRLLLGIGANEATIALQRYHSETDERRFSALVERSSDFIGFAGLDGASQYINPAGLALVGLAGVDNVYRLHVIDLLVEAERRRARNEIWPTVVQTGRWSGELDFRHFETGAAIPLLVDWFRIDNPRTARPMNIATVSRDLRAQKRSEAELRHLAETLEQRVVERTRELGDANRKLTSEMRERERSDARFDELQLELFHAARLSAGGQMAATLAHELSQPLTAATNSINAARRLLVRDEAQMIASVREVLDEAMEQVLRAGQIIRRLRDFVTRGETEKRVESVASTIEEASSLALTGSGALGVKVRVRFDQKVSNMFANRIQVQQVLVNLMRNAIEAMAGTERRELTITTALQSGEMVEIAVIDSGPGVSQSIIAHLFEPFVSTKRNGMGLGLSICRTIVESHGGQIFSEPNRDGGTIFRFTLPAVHENGETIHAA